MNQRIRVTNSSRRLLTLLACVLIATLTVPATASLAAPTTPVDVTSSGEPAASVLVPTAAPDPAAPQLSIAIDNGKTATMTGDKLDYVITVQNLGVADLDGLRVNQSLPPGMDFGTADADGAVDAGYVIWTVDLKATTTATFHTTMTVTATPAELLRLATVACASIAVDSPPVVCASHSDQLPAGAAAEAAKENALVVVPDPESQTWWYVLAGVAVAVGLAALGMWWVISRRRRAQPKEADALVLTR